MTEYTAVLTWVRVSLHADHPIRGRGFGNLEQSVEFRLKSIKLRIESSEPGIGLIRPSVNELSCCRALLAHSRQNLAVRRASGLSPEEIRATHD